MKKSKELKFARFGGLSPVVQKGYDAEMKTFHAPPKSKGIYCFVHPYIEKFLLSGAMSKLNTKHAKFEYVKDKDGNPKPLDVESSDWSFEKDGEYLTVRLKKPKVFEYYGEIWHHLGHQLKRGQIKERKGSWVKTSYENFKYAFFKEIYQMKFTRVKEGYGISKDHLEVFIERVK